MKVALVALALIWTILLHSAFGFYFRPAVIARKVSPKRLYGLQGTETTTDRTVHEGLPVGVKRSDLCSEFKNDIFIRPVPVCVISKPNVTEDVNVSLNNPHVRKESVLGPRPIKDDTNIDMRLALVNHNISTSISSENVTKLLLIQKLRSLRTATVVALNDKFGQWVDSFLVRLVWEFVSDKDIQLIDTEIRDVEVVKELYITSAVLQMIEEADQLQFIDMLKLGLPLPPEAYVDRFTKVFKITAADLQGRMRRLEREIMRDIRNEHRTGAVCVVGDTNPLGYANTKTAVKTATAVTSTARVSIVARLGITRSLAILGELLRRQKVAREKLLQLIASSQPDSHLSQSPEVVAACAFCDSLDAVFLLSQQERDRTVVDVVKQLASVMTATSLEGVLSTTLRSNPTFASFASVITNEPLKEAVREFAKSAHFCSVLAQDILKRFELMTASESELWPTSTDEDCIVVLSPMMGGLFGLSSATNDNFPSINNEAADDFAFNVTMQELLKEQKEERDVHSSAEVLLRDYFDIVSRKEGPVITRQGAGRIQQALLRGIMDVSAVKFFQGAVIYNGRMDQLRDSGVLARQIEERYQASDFRDEVDYTLVMNEAIPDLSGDIYSPDNVLNAVMSMGVSPALVVYPRAWNTTLSQVLQVPLFGTLRKVLSATALSTSLLYAADRTGALLPGSAFLGTGAVPAYLLPLLVTSSLMQNAAAVTERLVAMTKNVTMSQAFVPALSGTLFNFGHRSVYLNKTRTRADLFDTALSGVLTSLTLSTAAIATGLQLTARASTEAVSGFPTVPVSLLQINTFISQVFLPKFGELYQTYNPSALPEGLIPEPQVHLHWLTLVGITTFIAATLQLIPIGNSAGSKLLSATFGRQVAQNVSYIFAILRLVLYTAMFLNLGNVWAGPQITKARVLLDFLFFSQLLGNDHEAQIAADNWTEVGPDRKNVFFVLASVLVLSFFPYHFLTTQFNSQLLALADYARQLIRS